MSAVAGQTLGRLGEPATASASTWAAVGATIRTLHDAPLPPWPGKSVDELASQLEAECRWLADNDVLAPDVIRRNRLMAETVLRPWTPAFIHGDLHLEHVFVDGDTVMGIIDWSEACQGDALFDLASLTLGNEERLDDVVAGYGDDVDRALVRGWWSTRCLGAIRWLSENGYGAAADLPEAAILRSLR